MASDVAQMKSLMQRLVDAMNNRRLDELDELVASDFVRHCQATDMPINSLEDYKTFLRNRRSGLPRQRADVHPCRGRGR